MNEVIDHEMTMWTCTPSLVGNLSTCSYKKQIMSHYGAKCLTLSLLLLIQYRGNLLDNSKLLIVTLNCLICKLFHVLEMCNTIMICIYQLFADYFYLWCSCFLQHVNYFICTLTTFQAGWNTKIHDSREGKMSVPKLLGTTSEL